MGLVVFAVMGLYLLVSIGVVKGAIAYAREKGKSAKRWGWGAALVMWLIPFWDWIPTVAMHQYYCATEAGFWVYKTPEQWKKENPGIVLTEDKATGGSRIGNDENYTKTMSMNQRFVWKIEKSRPIAGLTLFRWKDEIVDKKSGQAVVRRVGFSTGEGRDAYKFWLNSSECETGDETRIALIRFSESIVNINSGDAK